LAGAGIVGVIHKATESSSYVDPTYAPRRQQAINAGLLWGAYHFLRPGDMVQQANYFLANAKPDHQTLLAADHEDSGVSLDDLKLFLQTIRVTVDQMPILYSGFLIKEQIGSTVDPEMANYALWLAQYTSGQPSWPTATWPSWWLWQYTDQGTIAGVSGNVDLNTYPHSAHQLRREWSG
jgi:lysozyme